MLKNRPNKEQLINGLKEGNKFILSRAISLSESTLPEDKFLITEVLENFSSSENSIRIGISGPPGAGKSTFIEALGATLVIKSKIAVLSVDPGSPISGGSILGDKTRMDNLSRNPNAYIRPSSSGTHLGGLAQSSYESILLAEAAGYEFILVETVGVGQSETEVYNMADLFILVIHTGAGDDLQAIKKGIMELPDAIIINKADKENKNKSVQYLNQVKQALHLSGKENIPLFTVSSIESEGIEEVKSWILNFQSNPVQREKLLKKRKDQSLQILFKKLQNDLWNLFLQDPDIKRQLLDNQPNLSDGVQILQLAEKLLKTFRQK